MPELSWPARMSVQPHLVRCMTASVPDGDVSALNEQASAVRYTMAQFPLQSALKQLIARHTGDECWLRLRTPLMQMSDERARELFSTFDAIGYDLPVAA